MKLRGRTLTPIALLAAPLVALSLFLTPGAALAAPETPTGPVAGLGEDGVSISGRVYDDRNQNGVYDDGDVGLEGLHMEIFTGSQYVYDPAIEDPDNYEGDPFFYAVTDAEGKYRFEGLATTREYTGLPTDNEWYYAVDTFEAPLGATSTNGVYVEDGTAGADPLPPMPEPGMEATDVDFAFDLSAIGADHPASETGVTLSGVIFEDLNGNGTQDDGENPLSGVEVYALNEHDGTFPIWLEEENRQDTISDVTDETGRYWLDDVPVKPSADAQYQVWAGFPDDDAQWESTTGLRSYWDGRYLLQPTTADLTQIGASEKDLDFAISQTDAEKPYDWQVIDQGHNDLIYPEFEDGENGQELKLNGHSDMYGVLDWDDLVVWNTDATRETLPDTYTKDADYSFIGAEGSTMYRSRESGPMVGSPWAGSSAESKSLLELPRYYPFEIRLEAVTAQDGGAAPGDAVLWTQDFAGSGQGAESTGTVRFSTKRGLPGSWTLGRGQHSHFNWSFTDTGVYCMHFSIMTELPDGTKQTDSKILTQIVGSDYDPETIAPCGRSLDFQSATQRDNTPQSSETPVVSGDRHASFAVDIDDSGELNASYREQPLYADGPDEIREIDDVILYQRLGSSRPYEIDSGERAGSREIFWDTLDIATDEVQGDISWSIDDVRGPGDVTLEGSGSWKEEKFDTAAAITEQQLWPASRRIGHTYGWSVSRPGLYCVDLSWEATKADGTKVQDSHTLTIVAEGPLDPDDYDDQKTGKDAYSGEVWEAADHGALDKTCDQGATPTTAEEVPAPDEQADDEPWRVPNHTTNSKGSLILNDGHLDVASIYEDGVFTTKVKDTTPEGLEEAGDAGALWHEPENVVMQLLPESKTAVPDDEAYRFLGEAGSPTWMVQATQQEGLLWPGWSTEHIDRGKLPDGVTWRLKSAEGPGNFALYTGSTGLGAKIEKHFDTSDGIDAHDTMIIPEASHVHGNWAFSAEGTYCLAFERTATTADGSAESDEFTLAFAVGRADPTVVDAADCEAGAYDPDQPGTDDPDQPGTDDPDQPGTDDPEQPDDSGSDEPADESGAADTTGATEAAAGASADEGGQSALARTGESWKTGFGIAAGAAVMLIGGAALLAVRRQGARRRGSVGSPR